MRDKLAFEDLVARFGEAEAVRVIEAIEAVVMFQDSVERIKQAPAQRLDAAMDRLISMDFAA